MPKTQPEFLVPRVSCALSFTVPWCDVSFLRPVHVVVVGDARVGHAYYGERRVDRVPARSGMARLDATTPPRPRPNS